MKATSPSIPLMEHRRYHKHRSKYKARKKSATTNELKKSFSKVSQQPRITEKRLTIKSGFNLNGAISTYPCSRGNKASNNKRGNTVDFDLKCLLQAAKNKGSIENLGSASTSSTISSGKGNSNSNDSPREKSWREKSKSDSTSYLTLPPKHKHSGKQLISSTFPENDMLLSGNDCDDSNCILPKVPSKICQDQDPHFQDSSGSTTRKRDLTNSSEISIPRVLKIKKRPSLSTRIKFVAGIIDSLVLEKQKQFPDSNVCFSERLKDTASNLTDLFRKTHSRNLPSAFDLVPDCDTNMLQKKEEPLQKLTNENIEQDKGFTGQRNNGKEGREFVTIPDLEIMDKDKQPMSKSDVDKYFKEKRVEAWVKAIQPNRSKEKNNESNQMKAVKEKVPVPSGKTGKHQTETEFLLNLENSIAKPTEKNPFEILAKPKPLWTVEEGYCGVSSPVLDPVPQSMSTNKMSCPSDSRHRLNSIHCKPSKRSEIDSFNNRQTAQLHRKGNSPIAIHPGKPKRNWFSWFTSSTDNKKGERDVSSEDFFKFNSQATKKGLPALPENQIKKNYEQPKKQGVKTFAKTPERWGQFPKIAKRNDESYPENRYILNAANETQEEVSDKTCLNYQFIKFAPRNMF